MVGCAWRWRMCIVCIASLLLCETERGCSLRESGASLDQNQPITAPDDTDTIAPETEGSKSEAADRQKIVKPDPMTQEEKEQAAIDRQKAEKDEAKDLDADMAALAVPTTEATKTSTTDEDDTPTTEPADSQDTEESADTEPSLTEEAEEDTETPDADELSRLDGSAPASGRGEGEEEKDEEPKEEEGNDEEA